MLYKELMSSESPGRKLLLGIGLGLIPLAASSAHAAVYAYGNFSGAHLSYNNVTETDTQLPGSLPGELFGAPVVSGDSLLFTPSLFSVAVSGGALELQDAHLSTAIVAFPKSNITSLSLTEGGGWSVGGGTSATTASDSLIVNNLLITSINGVSVNPIIVPANITFTDVVNGTAKVTTSSDAITFSSGAGISTGSWSGTANFNLAGAEAGAGFTGAITGLTLDLNDQLAAASEASSLAFIDKKNFDITTTSNSVPEPVMAGSIMAGASGLLVRRRRRVTV